MDSLLDYDSSGSTVPHSSQSQSLLDALSLDTNLRPISPQPFSLTPTMFGAAHDVHNLPAEPVDGPWLSTTTAWEQAVRSADRTTSSGVPRLERQQHQQRQHQCNDGPQPSGQSDVDIQTWLLTAAATTRNAVPGESTPRSASIAAGAPERSKKRPAPQLPPSPSSTALSVFVDELLGSDIDVEPDGDEPMTTTTVPTSTSEVSVPVTPRRPLVKVTAPKCDRCKLHSLSCNRSGKRTNCDHCTRVHSACTFNGIRASGAPGPIPRKKRTTKTNHQTPAAKKSKQIHTTSLGDTTRSSQRTCTRASRRADSSSRQSDDSGEIEQSDGTSDFEVVSFSKRESELPTPVSSDLSAITGRFAASTSLVSQNTASASAAASGGRLQVLDPYTIGLLRDIAHALGRVKGSLCKRSTLLALGPTLNLLLEGFDSMPRGLESPILSDIRSYLRRFRNECIPKDGRGDEVQQMSSTLLTQSLVDRILSLISALVA